MLRIFSEYSRKKENELTYQDKELVSVFTEFTRTSTTKVSKGFWTKNLDVMKATRDLFASTSEALKLIILNYKMLRSQVLRRCFK